MNELYLRIHHFLPLSRANGPGARAVIWVQGCSLNCPGCFNSQMQPTAGGRFVSVGDLYQRIVNLGNSIEGISISGGEPLQQYASTLALMQRIRRGTDLSILLFTGYTWEEVQEMPDSDVLLDCLDILIAGRYDASRHLARGLRGSANQTISLLTSRYIMDDLQTVPPSEVIITPEGDIIVSGVDPADI